MLLSLHVRLAWGRVGHFCCLVVAAVVAVIVVVYQRRHRPRCRGSAGTFRNSQTRTEIPRRTLALTLHVYPTALQSLSSLQCRHASLEVGKVGARRDHGLEVAQSDRLRTEIGQGGDSTHSERPRTDFVRIQVRTLSACFSFSNALDP